jgi:hypothetical protein
MSKKKRAAAQPVAEAQLPKEPKIETDAEREVRVKNAQTELAALFKKYSVSLNVTKLDISSGKIWPEINLVALPLSQ